MCPYREYLWSGRLSCWHHFGQHLFLPFSKYITRHGGLFSV
jgi:hypothetical protein